MLAVHLEEAKRGVQSWEHSPVWESIKGVLHQNEECAGNQYPVLEVNYESRVQAGLGDGGGAGEGGFSEVVAKVRFQLFLKSKPLIYS